MRLILPHLIFKFVGIQCKMYHLYDIESLHVTLGIHSKIRWVSQNQLRH